MLLEAAFPHSLERMRDRRLAAVFDASRRRDTAALCLSGGGIRSSTFALGIMQGLAKNGLLGKFDYLSTVSGGGLSGGWLSSWMRRSGAKSVHQALRIPGREKLQPEPEPVQGLRAFSHWLTPRAGAMSVDSWTVIATILRNLLLNWLVLIPLLAGLVMLPRLLLSLLAMDLWAKPADTDEALGIVWLALMAGVLLILVSAVFIEWVRDSGDEVAEGRRGAPTQSRVLMFFLVPLITGSMIVVVALWVGLAWRVDASAYIVSALLAVLLAAAVVGVTAMLRRGRKTRLQALTRTGKVLLSGIVGYGLAMSMLAIMSGWEDEWQRGLYMTLGPVVVLLGSVITSQLYTGLSSNEASDAEREWSARANAWTLIAALAWLVSSGLVLLGPGIVAARWQKLTLGGVGALASWLTVSLGKKGQAKTKNGAPAADGGPSAILSLAMPAVVACLIIGLAAVNESNINSLCDSPIFSEDFQCTPPDPNSQEATSAEKRTSAPLFEMIATRQMNDVVAADSALKWKLKHDFHFAVQRANLRVDTSGDAAIVRQSHAATALTLAFDTLERRRLRRNGEFSSEYDSVKTWIGIVRSALGDFTARRNDILSPDSAQVGMPNTPHTDSLLALTTMALKTRTALLADLRLVTTDTLKIHAFGDSIAASKGQARPGAKALWLGVLLLMVMMLGAGAIFSTVVNTNTFSLHAMWKARTVRAFLGTTRPSAARNPNPFTGFDSGDDLPMHELWPSRLSEAERAFAGARSEDVPPMHVLNVTLNLAAGGKLAWQQRKGESMTFSPLHAGSAFTGYRRMAPTSVANGDAADADGYGGKDGVSLGTAMAVSGAAASPNDGSGTTALGAFLMTLFNARLGWWLGNPGAPGADTWQRAAPKQRLEPILSEMLGLTSDRSEYVYLSDGGQFENLALYEMVFRRCRFIVVSDAGGDPTYTFEDLGNAVRKCRIDFGVPIDFEEPVRIRSGDKSAGAYWATARIRYSAVDMPVGGNAADYDGVLVYVKPAVYGVEPRDVVNYATLAPSFPQESSADQFFTESQFESYRELGLWIIDQLVANPAAAGKPATVQGHRDGSLLSAWPNLRG